MSEQIRTLGLYQPYAQLMMHGKIETRWVRAGRKPPFPLGRYLIYSTRKNYSLQELSQIAGERQYQRITDLIDRKDILHGYALCVGELSKIIYIVEGMEDETFVRYRPPYLMDDKHGRPMKKVMVGLVFKDVRPIRPFPFEHGKQGIGFLQPQDEAKIEFI